MENRKRMPSVATPSCEGRWSEADAARVLDEWSSSGGPLAAFARQHGVSPQRLAWWKKRLQRRAGAQATAMSAPVFLPVAVRAAPSAKREVMAAAIEVSGVHIELRVLDGASAAWVAALARALGGAS